MRHLFVLDPLERLLPAADTSIAFMRECARRGYGVWSCEIGDLSLRHGTPQARARQLDLAAQEGGSSWFQTHPLIVQALEFWDVVWMRKDPPVDAAYLYATHLLSLAPADTLVVNAPEALRDANEKLFALRFPELCPPTLVSCRIEDLLQFRDEMDGEMVIKPLDGAGGEGVFHIVRTDRNARTILEVMTRHEQEMIVAQRYLPEVRTGDKRVIVVDGEPVGAVLRVPASEETRANFHAGGSAKSATVGDREREICRQIGPVLVTMGIVFAGIDVIGDWLTEINITSPTGIREISRLEGTKLEEVVVDAVERRQRHATQPAEHAAS